MKAKTYGSCPAGATAPAKNYKTVNGEQQVTGCTIPDGTNAWISTVTATVVTILCLIALRWIAKLVERDVAVLEEQEAELAANHQKTMEVEHAVEAGLVHPAEGETPSYVSNKENGAVAKEPESLHETASVALPGTTDPTAVPREQITATGDGAPAVNKGGRPHRTPRMMSDLRKSKMWKGLTYGSNYDIHESVADDKRIMEIHREAEIFDRKSEGTFRYLQVLTACANSFAHGSNDVANAIGSMAAVYSIWECQCVQSKSNVPIWMFVIGGLGIVMGLSTYGYKIMRALGVKMMKLSNARGYCAELTSAIIVIISSRYGFPVSTTQVITGAITGIGMQEVIAAWLRKEKTPAGRFNFLLLLKFFAGWVATLVVAGVTAAAFVAQGIYSPSKPVADWRQQFNAQFNATNYGMAQTLIGAGNTTSPTPAQSQAFLWGQQLANATKLTWQTNNATMLNPTVVLETFQYGSWYIGNSTLAGVLSNAYMPTMPLAGLNGEQIE